MSTGHNLKTPLDGTEIIPFVVENGGSKATTAQDIADLGGGGGGVTDHGALTGLGDDDHTQYLTEARHDALPSDNPHNVTAAQTGAETSAQLDVRDTANRDRANHTGTQTASTISDFDTEVSNNPDVVANTAKVSFPGFTSLLADYGFTDNSANWDAAFSWGDHSLLGYLTDAPSDGTTYGRLNGAWAAISSGSSSLWTESGSDIYYDSGNVGIGTTTPSEKLDVQGNTVLGGDVTFEGAMITHTSTSAAGNYTILLTDHTIWKTGITGGGDTVTLPSGAADGQEFLIVDTSGTAGTNFISLATAGSELINGSATMAGAIRDDYGYIKLKFDGTNYFVIAK